MKKSTQLASLILLSLTLLSGNSYAKDTLIGNWTSPKIKLALRANQTYTYTVSILGKKNVFENKWSTKGNELTLNYTLLGEHMKKATYSFDNGVLVLEQGKKKTRLTRVKAK